MDYERWPFPAVPESGEEHQVVVWVLPAGYNRSLVQKANDAA